jgi:hypothetical protein
MRKREAIYLAIGRFMVEWSGLEFCLDLLVLASRNRSIDHRVPHQLEAKLTFLSNCLKSQDRLAAYADAMNELIGEVRAMSESRHDYVHGAIIDSAEEARPFAVTLHRLLQPSKKPRRHPVRVTARQIDAASDKAHALGDRLLDLTETVNGVAQSN